MSDEDGPHALTLETQGFVGHLTPTETQVLLSFKTYIAKAGWPRQSYMTDMYLLRFLRAREFSLNEAIALFTKNREWLQKQDLVKLSQSFTQMDINFIKQHYRHGYHGVDKCGRPIYIDCVGQSQICELIQQMPAQRILDYFIAGSFVQQTLILPACSLEKRRLIETTLTILDLDGLSFSMVTHSTVRRIFTEIVQMQQDHFPEAMSRMIIINAPRIFSLVWGSVKPVLSPKTQAKITILNGDFQANRDYFLKYIDADQLSQIFGGSCQCCTPLFLSDQVLGPWHSESWYDKILSDGYEECLLALAPPPVGGPLSEMVEAPSASNSTSENADWVMEDEGTCLIPTDQLHSSLVQLETEQREILLSWMQEEEDIRNQVGTEKIDRALPYYEALEKVQTSEALLREMTLVFVDSGTYPAGMTEAISRHEGFTQNFQTFEAEHSWCSYKCSVKVARQYYEKRSHWAAQVEKKEKEIMKIRQLIREDDEFFESCQESEDD